MARASSKRLKHPNGEKTLFYQNVAKKSASCKMSAALPSNIQFFLINQAPSLLPCICFFLWGEGTKSAFQREDFLGPLYLDFPLG